MFVEEEIRSALLLSSSNVATDMRFYLFSEWKIEVLRKTSHASTDEVQRSFHFLLRLDKFRREVFVHHEASLYISLVDRIIVPKSLCTFFCFKGENWISVLAFLCTECPRSFSGRGVVRSAFVSRTNTSTWTSMCASLCRRNRHPFLWLCSKKSLRHYCWSCRIPMSWFVYFMSIFFSWARKLDDIERWRAFPRDLECRVPKNSSLG